MRDEILSVIKQAHYFNSAYTYDNIYSFLRTSCDKHLFDSILTDLCSQGDVIKIEQHYYLKDYKHLANHIIENIDHSYQLFKSYQKYLKLFLKVPWVKLITLTGSNSFESCEKDKEHDIDLFIVTSEKRVWVTFICLFIIKTIFRKRYMIDANFFVDSSHLEIYHKSYYSAIQLMQMIPVHKSEFSEKLLDYNQWVKDYLPNAEFRVNYRNEYLIDGDKTAKKEHNGFFLFNGLNQLLFKAYNWMKNRYEKVDTQDECFYLTPNYAKLHKYAHHQTYDEIYSKQKITVR